MSIGADPDADGPEVAPVMVAIYDGDGLVVKECERASSAALPDDPEASCRAATHSNQSYWAVAITDYNDRKQPVRAIDPDGKISQTFYDKAGRAIVTIDAAGRKTRNVYDQAGRMHKVIAAWAGNTNGTGATLECDVMRAATAADSTKLQQCYQEYTYTQNNQIETVKDAGGNLTRYEYDAHDRLYRVYFPTKTGNLGQHNPDDYEQYSYDANGNMISKRVRDTGLGVITYQYDARNQLTERVVPGSGRQLGDDQEIYQYTYDLMGRETSSFHDYVTQKKTYDKAGRMTIMDVILDGATSSSMKTRYA